MSGTSNGFGNVYLLDGVDQTDNSIGTLDLPDMTMDFFAIVDYALYINSASNKTAIENKISDLIQQTNQRFQLIEIPVVLNLVNITYFTDFIEDENILGNTATTDGATLISNFQAYRGTRSDVTLPDFFWLFTGRTGLAAAAQAYIVHFTTWINIDTGNYLFTMLHSLGHNFGGRHDGTQNTCDANNYIMAAYNSSATDFSPCTREKINSKLISVFNLSDTIVPSIATDYNTITYELNSIGNELTWNATDSFPDTYSILLNNTPIVVDLNWANHTRETLDINGLNIGTYNYTIVYSDFFGNQNVNTIIVKVVDTTSPVIQYIGDTLFDRSSSGNFGEWSITDLQPNYVDVYVDNGFLAQTNWDSDTVFKQSLDAFSVGVHNITIVAYDLSSNFAVSSVSIEIVSGVSSSSSTTETSTSPDLLSSTPSSEDGLSYPLAIIFGSLFIIMYLNRKRELTT
ncbi:MAG: M12 family metallo-peptidase [Candidatus Kariarchaeaceae archaeon]|jgi:hypothetical protein